MHAPQVSALLLSVLLAPTPALALLDCKKMIIDKTKFDLSKLSGAHTVVTTRYVADQETRYNTTYAINICNNLSSGKGSKHDKCPNTSRVCAIPHKVSEGEDIVMEPIAIAGALENYGGTQFDYKLSKLKHSDSNSDVDKDGIRLVLMGGKHNHRPQKAVVEFICDPDKEGTEGEWESEDKFERRRRADDENDGDDKEDGGDSDDESVEHQLKKDDAVLLWKGYGPEKDADVLRLEWRTKYACSKPRDGGDDGNKGDDKDGDKDDGEGGDKDPQDGDNDDEKDPKDGNSSAHWGFFTWLVIVAFLGTAAYLIFGSWLNYNRYGARGWDLVPHGDTLRDVPYLMKDWTRRVLNTVQGTGSRGGYSAV